MTDQTQQSNSTQTTQTATPWYGEAHKEFVTTKGWKTPDDVIVSNQNLEKLLGADKAGRAVVLPKDDNDVEGVKAFRAKLGVPEKVDGYQLPQEYRDSLKDDPLMPHVAAAALKHGIPAKAYEGFLADVLAAAGKNREAADKQLEDAGKAAVDALKAKHGDKFDAKVELGRRLVSQTFTDENGKALEGEALSAKVDAMMRGEFTPADVMSMFIALGDKLGEPGAAGGQNMGGNVNAATAQEKLDELRAKRIAGQISERDYLEQADKLGKIAQPGVRAA